MTAVQESTGSIGVRWRRPYGGRGWRVGDLEGPSGQPYGPHHELSAHPRGAGQCCFCNLRPSGRWEYNGNPCGGVGGQRSTFSWDRYAELPPCKYGENEILPRRQVDVQIPGSCSDSVVV